MPSPVIATSLPPSCSRLISAILSSGLASARKSSTPASSAIAFAVSGLSPVIMTVRMPIRRSSSNRSRHALLDDVLQLDDAEHPGTVPSTRSATTSGVPPAALIPSTICPVRGGTVPPLSRTHAATADAAPLRICRAGFAVDGRQVHAAHPRLRGERRPRLRASARPAARSRRP